MSYWYREELKQVYKEHGIAHTGTKAELNSHLKAYFNGEIVKPLKRKNVKKSNVLLTLDSKVLASGFVMNGRFRAYFAKITGNENYKFTAATTLRKIRQEQDTDLTIGKLLDINYAKYDNSSWQWNQFLKYFCADRNNDIYYNKLKAASTLWKIVREQPGQKIYTASLSKEYGSLLKEFLKKE